MATFGAPRATTIRAKSPAPQRVVAESAISRNVVAPSKVTAGRPLMPLAVSAGWRGAIVCVALLPAPDRSAELVTGVPEMPRAASSQTTRRPPKAAGVNPELRRRRCRPRRRRCRRPRRSRRRQSRRPRPAGSSDWLRPRRRSRCPRRCPPAPPGSRSRPWSSPGIARAPRRGPYTPTPGSPPPCRKADPRSSWRRARHTRRCTRRWPRRRRRCSCRRHIQPGPRAPRRPQTHVRIALHAQPWRHDSPDPRPKM